MAACLASITGVMSTNVVGVKLQSSGWWGSNSSNSGGSTTSNALGTPAPAARARARHSTAKNAAAWSGLNGYVIGVREENVRRERADPVGDGDEGFAVDLERVVAEVEALELGPERGGGPLGLAVGPA